MKRREFISNTVLGTAGAVVAGDAVVTAEAQPPASKLAMNPVFEDEWLPDPEPPELRYYPENFEFRTDSHTFNFYEADQPIDYYRKRVL